MLSFNLPAPMAAREHPFTLSQLRISVCLASPHRSSLTGLELLGILRPPYSSTVKPNVGRLRQVNKKSAPLALRGPPLWRYLNWAVLLLLFRVQLVIQACGTPCCCWLTLLILLKRKLGSYTTYNSSFSAVFLPTFKVGLHLQPCRSLKGVFFDIRDFLPICSPFDFLQISTISTSCGGVRPFLARRRFAHLLAKSPRLPSRLRLQTKHQ